MHSIVPKNDQGPLPIVVLISGGGSNLQAIIDNINNGLLNAKICAVISNKANAYGLQRAQQTQIPTEVIDHEHYPDRQSFDAQLTQCIESYQPKLIILAGFMRILTDDFVNHFYGKMINIHPSLLPKYRGLNTHQRALDAGDTEHGLSIHFVSAELDGGPLILQQTVPVLEDDNAQTLSERVLEQEHRAYSLVINWFANNRIDLIDEQVLLDGKRMTMTPGHDDI